jgi:hypothetical protein
LPALWLVDLVIRFHREQEAQEETSRDAWPKAFAELLHKKYRVIFQTRGMPCAEFEVEPTISHQLVVGVVGAGTNAKRMIDSGLRGRHSSP